MSSSNTNNKSTEQHFSYQKDSNKDQNKDWNKDLNKDKDLHSNDLNMNKDLHKDKDMYNKDLHNKDLSKPYSGSDAAHHDIDADKNKTEKTSITFEKKKEKVNDKDVDMKDKNLSSQQKNAEGKGFMDTVKENLDTVKEKVKGALSSGDNDKDVQRTDKDKHVGAGYGYNQNKDVGMSGVSSSQHQHQSDLGASAGSHKYSSNQEHDKLHSGAAFSSEKQKGVLPATGVVQEERVIQEDKPITGVIYEKQGLVHEKPGMIHEKAAIGAIHHEKPAAGLAHEKPMPGVIRDDATIDRVGLGAEHREVGYDKHANVVADKNKDVTDIHAGGIRTGTAVGSSAGTTQGGAFKTIESK